MRYSSKCFELLDQPLATESGAGLLQGLDQGFHRGQRFELQPPIGPSAT